MSTSKYVTSLDNLPEHVIEDNMLNYGCVQDMCSITYSVVVKMPS